MRIGVISDTHISDKAQELPEKILEGFAGVDMIVHAGDLVDLDVLKKLKSVCTVVLAVWGNMDPPEVRSQLHEKEIINVARFKIGLMHGYGAPSRLIDVLSAEFKDDKVDVIIFGHSHNPVNEKKGNVLFFNPGSATDKVFAEYNSYGILEINDKIEAKIIKL